MLSKIQILIFVELINLKKSVVGLIIFHLCVHYFKLFFIRTNN